MRFILSSGIALLAAIYSPLLAQQQLEWYTTVGSPAIDEGTSIALDHNGRVVSGGFYSSTLDIDPGVGTQEITSSGGLDCFIQVVNAYGDFEWAATFGGGGQDYLRDVSLDGEGAVYAAGTFADTLFVGDTTLVALGSNDIFAVKYSAEGVFEWARGFGSTGDEDCQSIHVDAVHGVHVGAGYFGTIDFDPGPADYSLTSNGNRDGVIIKLGLDGAFQWAASSGGPFEETVEGIGVDSIGNVVNAGNFRGLCDFDPGPGEAFLTGQGNDIYIQKLTAEGEFIWAKKIGGNSEDLVRDMALDDADNILITGEFKSTFDFDPGPASYLLTSNGIADFFFCKYTPEGELVWADFIGGGTNDAGYAICGGPNGTFHATGFFTATADILPGPDESIIGSTGGSRDMITYSFESDGTLIEAMHIVGNNDEYGFAIAADSAGQLYVSGRFHGPCDLDPSPSVTIVDNNFSLPDAYTIKLSECPTLRSFPQLSSCQSYDFNGAVLDTSGVYEAFSTTVNGCDSLITLDLTITQPTSASIQAEVCDSVVINEVTYLSAGEYQQTLENTAGCDSLLTITVVGLIDTTLVSARACEEYSFAGSTLTTSGSYIDSLSNTSGCDSLIFLDLIIVTDSVYAEQVVSCDTYTYGDSTYVGSAMILDSLISTTGCDSTVAIMLTIGQEVINEIEVTSCFDYSFGGSTLTASGSYTDTLSTLLGCDSIITLELVIDTVDLMLDTSALPFISADPAAESWQWIECDGAFDPIIGADSATYEATMDMAVAVIITSNGCTDTTQCVSVNVDALKEFDTIAMTLFPNPTSGHLTIELPDSRGRSIMLTDLSGRLIERRDFSAVIDLSALAEGIYVLQVVSDKGQASRRVVVSR